MHSHNIAAEYGYYVLHGVVGALDRYDLLCLVCAQKPLAVHLASLMVEVANREYTRLDIMT